MYTTNTKEASLIIAIEARYFKRAAMFSTSGSRSGYYEHFSLLGYNTV
jgi:hypothetical protein